MVGAKGLIVEDYRMEAVAQGCATCEKKFEIEEVFYSTIVDGDSCFERKDYCTGCWSEGLIASTFSSWRTRFPKEPKSRTARLDLDQIRSFFEKLVTSVERHHREMCYVLALILLRKKKLRFADRAALKNLGLDPAKVSRAERRVRKAIQKLEAKEKEKEAEPPRDEVAKEPEKESNPEASQPEGRETVEAEALGAPAEDSDRVKAEGGSNSQTADAKSGDASTGSPGDEGSDESKTPGSTWELLTLVDPKEKRVYHVAAPTEVAPEKLAELNDELLLLMSLPPIE